MTNKHPDGKPELRPARSGTERQRQYRAKRRAVSIDISRETADAIRALRDATQSTTDAVLSRALGALQELLHRERSASQQMMEEKRSRRGTRTHPAPVLSPGDDTAAGPLAADETSTAVEGRATRKRSGGKKGTTTKTQLGLDL